VNYSRPKNLNLLTIRFPLPAIVSIFHRLSGAALFLLIPFLLWALSFSLTPSGFESIQTSMDNILVKFIIWLVWVPFCYHLVAGIRHLLMDIHIGSSLKGGKRGAALTFIFTFILVILAGIWLW
jgi:succinate dehydrogenase / fumarate reductase cytochrome b subunit